MTREVELSIRGQQAYADQEPETIELITDGVLRCENGTYRITYEESALTGMEGVQTDFLIEDNKITLTRSGKLQSQMIFAEGVAHDSLYQMEFGALMLTVCATHIAVDLSPEGGTVDLDYKIEIEQNAAGTICYHLDVRPKNA